jgi:hypothetical protein
LLRIKRIKRDEYIIVSTDIARNGFHSAVERKWKKTNPNMLDP